VNGLQSSVNRIDPQFYLNTLPLSISNLTCHSNNFYDNWSREICSVCLWRGGVDFIRRFLSDVVKANVCWFPGGPPTPSKHCISAFLRGKFILDLNALVQFSKAGRQWSLRLVTKELYADLLIVE
jgi:hypothetical protein